MMAGADVDAALDAAMQCRRQGRLQEAEALYQAVLAARPRDCDVLQALADLALQSRRMEAAVEHLKAALAIRPDVIMNRFNLGTALRYFGRLEEALEEYDAAIALNSADPVLRAILWTNRGAVLRALGRLDDAVESANRAFPDHPEACNDLGYALQKAGRAEDAIKSYDRAIALKADYVEAWTSRGNVLCALGRWDDAVESHKHAIGLRPDYAEAWSNLGHTLCEAGRPDDAIKSYNRAIALKPEFSDVRYNRGVTLLLLGEFESGWRDYEHRKLQRTPSGNRSYPNPLWSKAEDQQGETVLVHAEQGLGDTLQFCRYLPMLEGLGVKVLFAPQPPLRALMRSLSPTIEIVDADDPALRFDRHAPLMSLPLILGTALDTIPAEVPYIAADPDRIARWRDRIGENGFRIGVCWRGTSQIPARAFPPSCLAGLAALPGVRLISLQKGEGEAELVACPQLKIERLDGLDDGSGAFMDTAAVMQGLDLIITCDTAVAHLAGALARSTWVALKHVPDWRWLLGRTDSPWYPTLRLFRQKNRGDWASVFAEMEGALRRQLRAEPEGLSPIP
jgi:tetratricopeptide (TPR) repeat protein